MALKICFDVYYTWISISFLVYLKHPLHSYFVQLQRRSLNWIRKFPGPLVVPGNGYKNKLFPHHLFALSSPVLCVLSFDDLLIHVLYHCPLTRLTLPLLSEYKYIFLLPLSLVDFIFLSLSCYRVNPTTT